MEGGRGGREIREENVEEKWKGQREDIEDRGHIEGSEGRCDRVEKQEMKWEEKGNERRN
jgi:hypothetical protein